LVPLENRETDILEKLYFKLDWSYDVKRKVITFSSPFPTYYGTNSLSFLVQAGRKSAKPIHLFSSGQCNKAYIYNRLKYYIHAVDPGGRYIQGPCLQPLDCCDLRFKSRCCHGSLFLVFVVCCLGSVLCDKLITGAKESCRVCVLKPPVPGSNPGTSFPEM